MKRKGFTLIEMIISLALLSILFLSMMSIFGSTAKNVSINAEDINTANWAKSELNLAIKDKNYLGENTQLENADKVVKVLGTDVTVRYINSPLQNGTSAAYSIYVTDGVKIITNPEPPVGPPGTLSPGPDENFKTSTSDTGIFFDFDKNGVFDKDTSDTYISKDSLNNFDYFGTANVVVSGPVDMKVGNDSAVIDMNMSNQLIFNPGGSFETKQSVIISASDVLLSEGSSIFNNNKDDIKINATNQVSLQKNSFISMKNGGNIDITCLDFSAYDGATVSVEHSGNIGITAQNNITLERNASISSDSGDKIILACSNILKISQSHVTAGAGAYLSITGLNDVNIESSSTVSTTSGNIAIVATNFTADNSEVLVNGKNNQDFNLNINASNNCYIKNNSNIVNNANDIIIECLNYRVENSVVSAVNNLVINATNIYSMINDLFYLNNVKNDDSTKQNHTLFKNSQIYELSL